MQKQVRCALSCTRTQRGRYAHAATAPSQDEENQAGPSNYYRSDASSSGPGSKGKSPDRGETNEYRFPAKGRGGGPPDPFDVMALDRSASQAEVKKQCESDE